MTGVLARGFFGRAAAEVAPDLLGCVLVHDSPDGLVAVRIVETEAYAGRADPASHAYGGPTARNAVMFGPPGHAYVYFSYGMHFCANLVCRPAGDASAVLLRAGQVIQGADLAATRRAGGRRAAPPARELARGPGRLCQALGIDRGHDGADVCAGTSALRVSRGAGRVAGAGLSSTGISSGPRVGVSRAADVPWRFWLTGDPCVSAYRASVPRRARAKPVTGSDPASGTMHQ